MRPDLSPDSYPPVSTNPHLATSCTTAARVPPNSQAAVVTDQADQPAPASIHAGLQGEGGSKQLGTCLAQRPSLRSGSAGVNQPGSSI